MKPLELNKKSLLYYFITTYGAQSPPEDICQLGRKFLGSLAIVVMLVVLGALILTPLAIFIAGLVASASFSDDIFRTFAIASVIAYVVFPAVCYVIFNWDSLAIHRLFAKRKSEPSLLKVALMAKLHKFCVPIKITE